MIIKANSLSSSQFADQIGLKRSNLSHVLSGRNKPSLDFLSKIITHFPNVNASWLITGETREGDYEGNRPSAVVDSKTSVISSSDAGKELKKIVLLYQDGTFDEFDPNVQ